MNSPSGTISPNKTPSFCLCLPGAGHVSVHHLIQLRNISSNTLWRNQHGGPTGSQMDSLVLVGNARVKSFNVINSVEGQAAEVKP